MPMVKWISLLAALLGLAFAQHLLSQPRSVPHEVVFAELDRQIAALRVKAQIPARPAVIGTWTVDEATRQRRFIQASNAFTDFQEAAEPWEDNELLGDALQWLSGMEYVPEEYALREEDPEAWSDLRIGQFRGENSALILRQPGIQRVLALLSGEAATDPEGPASAKGFETMPMMEFFLAAVQRRVAEGGLDDALALFQIELQAAADLMPSAEYTETGMGAICASTLNARGLLSARTEGQLNGEQSERLDGLLADVRAALPSPQAIFARQRLWLFVRIRSEIESHQKGEPIDFEPTDELVEVLHRMKAFDERCFAWFDVVDTDRRSAILREIEYECANRSDDSDAITAALGGLICSPRSAQHLRDSAAAALAGRPAPEY